METLRGFCGAVALWVLASVPFGISIPRVSGLVGACIKREFGISSTIFPGDGDVWDPPGIQGDQMLLEESLSPVVVCDDRAALLPNSGEHQLPCSVPGGPLGSNLVASAPSHVGYEKPGGLY